MLKSYSKINLSLRVIKKLPNKLHDIQSNVFQINLFDEINVKKIKKLNDNIIFFGPFSKLIDKKDNSISKSLKILRSKNLIKGNYEIRIKKNIPTFAGLGGGTSNSAYIVKYFLRNKIKKLKYSDYEKLVGSDFRLFFNKQSYQKSLKKILKYKKNFNFHIVLTYPNIRCSTKLIYSKVRKYKRPLKINYATLKDKEKFCELIANQQNDLQTIVEKKFPIIKKLAIFISSQKGCILSRMSGSGSVCFGIFKSQKNAKLSYGKIKSKFPHFWHIITKTI